jgi:pyruvate,orthophosphate dikinase
MEGRQMSFARFGKHVETLAQPDEAVLGGKGAGLVRMSALGIPVPPGFTLGTSYCRQYQAEPGAGGGAAFVQSLMPAVMADMGWLEETVGCRPLVSVRSGAPVSMPGMMDSILDVGLTSATFAFWENRLGPRAVRDSRRRLIQMLGSTAYGVPREAFDKILSSVKTTVGCKQDRDLDPAALDLVIDSHLQVFESHAGPFPDTLEAQLAAAIGAVFKSWNNERAITYRTLNRIDPSMGTAVTIQSMVFGNLNDDSGSGVLFSRDGNTGANALWGEFLPNAQGEDVVAGIATPLTLGQMQGLWPGILDELNAIACTLEHAYRDMVDLEFTVQDKVLYLLQCRTGKRSALAAFRIARDLVKEGMISKATAIGRLSREQYKITKRPVVDPAFAVPADATGLFGSPGVASGRPVHAAADAVAATEPCILVAHDTDPNDVGGMKAATGIVTATGGQTSHAAVVARAMNKPCVVGCAGVVDLVKARVPARLTIDGATGRVWFRDVPVVDNSADEAVAEIVSWIVKTDEGGAPPSPARIPASALTPDTCAAIEAAPDKSTITIDLSCPADTPHPDDAPLADLYGNSPGTGSVTREVAHKWLLAQGPKLAGISVIGAPVSANLGALGMTVISPVASSLEDLLEGGEMLLDKGVVESVGPSAIAKIEALLAAAGKPLVKVVKSPLEGAQPPEYQVFKALS